MAAVIAGCSKDPGFGGDASITGHVRVRDYNTTFTQLIAEYPAEDTYVYLRFGDRPGYEDRVKTDYEGNFEFRFLYRGDYEIYLYSRDSTLTDPNEQVPVIRHLSISERKETVDLGTLIIFD